MKILVTGGAGFIGKHLVKELVNRGEAPDICDILNGDDILDWEFDKTYDIIYHLAAYHSVPLSFEKPSDFFKNNIYGTYRLLTSGRWKRFINISSSCADDPISPYGMSKYLAEKATDFFDNVINIRPFNIFGEGQPNGGPLIPNLIKAMMDGETPIIEGDGKQKRDFTYVKDFVNQLIWYAEHKKKGTYDIGYQKPLSVNYVFDCIAKNFEYKKKPRHIARRKGDMDYTKAKNKLTIKNPIGFREGLERTMLSWQRG